MQTEEGATTLLVGVAVADGKLPKLQLNEMSPNKTWLIPDVVRDMAPVLVEEHTMNDSYAVL